MKSTTPKRRGKHSACLRDKVPGQIQDCKCGSVREDGPAFASLINLTKACRSGLLGGAQKGSKLNVENRKWGAVRAP